MVSGVQPEEDLLATGRAAAAPARATESLTPSGARDRLLDLQAPGFLKYHGDIVIIVTEFGQASGFSNFSQSSS